MPVLSMFFGIIVRMYREQGGKHNMPHIHAEYSGEEVVVALDGTVLEGEKNFPRNKLKMLEVWMDIHHEDLEANWKLLSNGEQFFRIDPLKYQPGFGYSHILFECISAIGTVGMTTGITPLLDILPKIVIAMLMYIGRITSLVFAFSIIFSNKKTSTKKPTGNIMIG